MKILLVDDDPTQVLIARRHVERLGHQCVTGSNGFEAVEVFKAESPSLVFMDVEMLEMDGYEAARRIRELEGGLAWTPIIFLTGMDSDEDLTAAIEAGGDDYLTKPLRAVVLAAKIKAWARLHDMRSELDNARRSLQTVNEELRHLSAVDALTGIANRRRFDEMVEVEWARALREGSSLSLVLIDIDHFKDYNDRYGHFAGDDCLRRVAQALEAATSRPPDLVARYGGEEFAVLLPLTAYDGGLHIGDHLRASVQALGIPHEVSRTAPYITISGGICTMTPNNQLTVKQLISCADEQLYAAKHGGRNRIAGCAIPPREPARPEANRRDD